MKKTALKLLAEIEGAARVCRDLVEENATPETAPINMFWSRAPGKFVDKTDGNVMTGASFTGTVREWYETLIEVAIDADLTMVRRKVYENKFARSRIYVAPDVSTIIEASVLYKPLFGTAKTDTIGHIMNRFEVILDENVPRDEIHFVVDPFDWRLPRRLGAIVHVMDMSFF